MKSDHIKKIEARRQRVLAVLIPDTVTRQHDGHDAEVNDPRKRLAQIINRVDSAERGAVSPNGRTTRTDVEDILRLLETDLPELIDVAYEANSAKPRMCRYCMERREGLLVRNPDTNRMECRDQDGCAARQARAGISEEAG